MPTSQTSPTPYDTYAMHAWHAWAHAALSFFSASTEEAEGIAAKLSLLLTLGHDIGCERRLLAVFDLPVIPIDESGEVFVCHAEQVVGRL